MTGRQIQIIRRLLAGDKIRRYDQRHYRWYDKDYTLLPGPFVKKQTLVDMFDAGLLRVGALHGETEARYLPTDIAKYEVEKLSRGKQ